jgi:hypothetical protein
MIGNFNFEWVVYRGSGHVTTYIMKSWRSLHFEAGAILEHFVMSTYRPYGAEWKSLVRACCL